ncbi:hypothetical protein CsSME_00001438 [Camellia sinensis var. sinensis]
MREDRSFGGGWQPVLYKRRDLGHNRRAFASNLITIFVDNLPAKMDPKRLFRMYSKFGVVRHVFIPYKKSRVGTKFGFVRYDCEVVAGLAIQKTNGVWCANKELKVKLADFVKSSGRKAVFTSNAEPLGGQIKAPKVNSKITILKEGKSFAEVVKQGGVEVTSCLKVLASDEGCDWLDSTMIVRLKSLNLVGSLEAMVKKYNHNVNIRFGGGNIVLLSFGSKVELDKEFSSVAVIIQDLCEEIRSWGEDFVLEPSRLVWLHCFGIPFHVWNPSTLQRIGNLWGDIIRIDFLDSNSLVCGRILVHTRVMETINSKVLVDCHNKQFDVFVKEGLSSLDFVEEIGQKWGLRSIVDCRSESSVAGDRSRKVKSQAEVVGNDEVVQSLSSQKVVGVHASGMHGHWDLVSAVNESSSKHALQREVCDLEGRRFLNCDRPDKDMGFARSQVGFMRSFSRSIGPQPGLNLEVVLGEPSFVGPHFGNRCTITDIEEMAQNSQVEPLNIGENFKIGLIEEAPVGSVKEVTSGSIGSAKIMANLQTKSEIRDVRKRCKNSAPVKVFKGSLKYARQRSRNQLSTSKKGASLKAAIAKFSLASSSKLGSCSGRIILNEAQATVQLGKALGIDFDDQEDAALNRIADLERQDVARIEQRRHQQIR